jgi:hypothetical protein
LPAIDGLVKDYAAKVPQLSETFVQYLHGSEIENLIEAYSLANVALVSPVGLHDGCGCGCGCE